MESRYYVADNGHQTGPFTRAEVRAKSEAGEIGPDTLVWTHGMDDWAAAESVSDISEIVTSGPPPIPGS